MDTITIPKKLIRGDDLVVVRRKDFEAFERWQNEIRDALAKVKRGKREYKQGKTVSVFSSRAFR
ncbi:MAG TPA: hypothetical protein VJB92_01750 [Candidatus Paceibacterota bacterium]